MSPPTETGVDPLIRAIQRAVIGDDALVDGPFGPKPVVYADYTASGRALTFIEDYLSTVVLPLYANTHSESSGTGRQTSQLRAEARQIIADAVGATDDHVVLFSGTGATGAIAHLIGVLGLRIASTLEARHHLSDHIALRDRPVVFLGPYEHHSNELPWRESIADVVTIDEDGEGHVDLRHLERELTRYQDRSVLIGSFSAASNVTGVVTDTRAVSLLLHEFGALAFWDYAAAAPYVAIDMAPSAGLQDGLDAVFISAHKFIGGPGTPGILIANRSLFTNAVPHVPGGGTVAFVGPTHHDYVDDIEEREEGGTPDIIGSIRAGLVFQLKAAVGADAIRAREKRFLDTAIRSWSEHPRLELLGPAGADRLSIVSFMIRADNDRPDNDRAGPTEALGGLGRNRFLHHNFVVALLNDLFGIQARGGCSCAGPYGHRLLGIDPADSDAFEREIQRGCEGIKPGWTRVNFNYFIDDETFRYIVDAVSLVADSGAEMLPYYRFAPDTGQWTHRDGVSEPVVSLRDLAYREGRLVYEHAPTASGRGELREHFAHARGVIESQSMSAPSPHAPPQTTDDFERLRWFPYPHE